MVRSLEAKRAAYRDWYRRKKIEDPEYFCRKYAKGDPERRRALKRAYLKRVRLLVLNHYGNCCVCCGESQYEFLAMDHINGGGAQHRRDLKNSKTICEWLKTHNFPDGFQILCHNCNMARGFYGQCPHERGTEK